MPTSLRHLKSYSIKIPVYKRLLSYLYPVRLRQGYGSDRQFLEVYLYLNQYQLATVDALYSDGNRYLPAVNTVKSLKRELGALHNVLILGGGLASMVRVLHSRGVNAHCTVVELDQVILDWAIEFLEKGAQDKVTAVCDDARLVMAQNEAKYDLVFIDVFNGRVVPEFVYSAEFLEQCRAATVPGRHVAFNYIVNNAGQWEQVQATFAAVFPDNKILNHGINRILIGVS